MKPNVKICKSQSVKTKNLSWRKSLVKDLKLINEGRVITFGEKEQRPTHQSDKKGLQKTSEFKLQKSMDTFSLEAPLELEESERVDKFY